MNITHSLHINTTPEKLWDHLTDFKKLQQWSSSIISETPISSGDPRPGFISKMMIREGSKTVEYESEITAFDPCALLGMTLRGGSLGKGPMTVNYTLSPNKTGSTIDYEANWQPKGLMLKLMHPIIAKVARKNVLEQMDKLKTLLES